jgi:hypothetical protein
MPKVRLLKVSDLSRGQVRTNFVYLENIRVWCQKRMHLQITASAVFLLNQIEYYILRPYVAGESKISKKKMRLGGCVLHQSLLVAILCG